MEEATKSEIGTKVQEAETSDCQDQTTESTEQPEDIQDNQRTKLLSDEEKKECKETCLKLKETGNENFKAGEYEDAITIYSQAVEQCLEEFNELKATLFANRGACYVKMGEHAQSITDCTSALELNPKYIKARLRRAQCYETTDKLDEAFEDYKAVLEQDRTNKTAGEACMRLPDQIKERNEKMKEEMMGKLKDLGNMVLKPFGLSTDNFKVEQDPNSGGYSINFQK